jgi:hypothetical protein
MKYFVDKYLFFILFSLCHWWRRNCLSFRNIIRIYTQATDNYHTIIYNVNRKIKIPKVYLEVVNRRTGKIQKFFFIRIRISKKNRQHNVQKKKYKGTNNNLQNIYKTKDRLTRTPLKPGVISDVPEG